MRIGRGMGQDRPQPGKGDGGKEGKGGGGNVSLPGVGMGPLRDDCRGWFVQLVGLLLDSPSGVPIGECVSAEVWK